jgi:hypothetical protein
MTTKRAAHAARRTRWPKRRVQWLAWITAGVTAAASGVAIAAERPASPTRTRQPRQRVIERHVIRRVIVVDPPTASAQAPGVTYVPAPVAAAPAPAPAPAPATTTSGS